LIVCRCLPDMLRFDRPRNSCILPFHYLHLPSSRLRCSILHLSHCIRGHRENRPIRISSNPSTSCAVPCVPQLLAIALIHWQLPKVLLPHQEGTLTTRIANLEELITEESTSLAKEKESVAELVRTNRVRIDELVTKLERLRKQVKPVEKVEKDDFGRAPREEMEVDRDGDREAGWQIKGEDGDVEVEY